MYYAGNKEPKSTDKVYYQPNKEKRKDCNNKDKECT